jgi:DNA-binding transcriptional MerR regulator
MDTLADRVTRIGFTLGQVCEIVGITKTRLDYWTVKARIPTRGRKQRIYDYAAVELVAGIKAGVDRGLSLAAAIEQARGAGADA